MRRWLCFTISVVFANPQGLQVQSGSASTLQKGAVLEIRASNGAILHWDSFSIGKEELTRFLQAGSNAAVLNRVTGSEMSQILGRLEANGKVYLINPNGLLIGNGAVINTAAFIASTMTRIENRGTIETTSGPLVLLAPEIDNYGLLKGPHILLANGAIISVEEEESSLLDRLQKEGAEALAIRHTGKIQADTVEKVGGKVFLRASHVEVQGKIEAPHVEIRGGIVQLEKGSEILAKKVQIEDAKIIWTDPGSVIQADEGEVILRAQKAMVHRGYISIRGLEGDGGFAEVSGPYLEYQGTVDGRAPFGKTGRLLIDPNDIEVSSNPTTGSFGACPSTYEALVTPATNQILTTDLTAQLDTCDTTIDTTITTGSGPNGGSIAFLDSFSWSGSQLTLNAATSITFGDDFTVGGGATLTTNAGTDISFEDGINFTSAGTASIVATGDINIGAVSFIFSVGSIQAQASGAINITGAVDLSESRGTGSMELTATGAISINGDTSINDIPTTFTAGQNIALTNSVTSTSGDMVFLAGNNFTSSSSITIGSTGGGNITIVADNNNPSSVGSGVIDLTDSVTLSADSGNLQLYTSTAAASTFPSTINGVAAPGTFTASGVFYPNGSGGVPFMIFYKASSPPPPTPGPTPQQQQTATTATAISVSSTLPSNSSVDTNSPTETTAPPVQSTGGLNTSNPAPCGG